MLVTSILILIFATSLETMLLELGKPELKLIPDYVDMFSVPKQTRDLKTKFLKKKMQKKVQNFNDHVSNNIIYVDGISHFDITKNPSKWKNAYDIENDFKDILSMQYMKYIYQRDGHWRTWREIKYPDGKKKIIFYKSQSIVPENCTYCETRGTWVIEEGTPPCPFELFSVINSAELCAVNYMRLKEKIGRCPSIIKFMDLTGTCDNPIVTKWRITRDYTISGRFNNVVCGGREFCDIVTLYQILPQHVIFRIINATNILYSRVMKNNKKNYACVGQCGEINLKTFAVKPINILNLLAVKEKKVETEVVKRVITNDSKVKQKNKKIKNKKPKVERLRVDNFYNPGNTQPPKTTKAHYKKIVEKNPHESELETYYDTYEHETQED